MVDAMEEMLNAAVEDINKGEDFATLYPRKIDKKVTTKIFKKLIKQGIVKELPDYCK